MNVNPALYFSEWIDTWYNKINELQEFKESQQNKKIEESKIEEMSDDEFLKLLNI